MRNVLATLLLGTTLALGGTAALASENTPDSAFQRAALELNARPIISIQSAGPAAAQTLYDQQQTSNAQYRVDNQEGSRR